MAIHTFSKNFKKYKPGLQYLDNLTPNTDVWKPQNIRLFPAPPLASLSAPIQPVGLEQLELYQQLELYH